jgi:outer membrane biosynthesis protein TonB
MPSPTPEPTPSPTPDASPTPEPTPTPQPTPEPTPQPTPEPTPVPPVVDRAAPSVVITSSRSAPKKSYVLRATVADDLKPARLRYRLRPPGKTSFQAWTYSSLRGDAARQTWARQMSLPKKGKWRIEVQAYDASGRASGVRATTVKRR